MYLRFQEEGTCRGGGWHWHFCESWAIERSTNLKKGLEISSKNKLEEIPHKEGSKGPSPGKLTPASPPASVSSHLASPTAATLPTDLSFSHTWLLHLSLAPAVSLPGKPSHILTSIWWEPPALSSRGCGCPPARLISAHCSSNEQPHLLPASSPYRLLLRCPRASFGRSRGHRAQGGRGDTWHSLTPPRANPSQHGALERTILGWVSHSCHLWVTGSPARECLLSGFCSSGITFPWISLPGITELISGSAGLEEVLRCQLRSSNSSQP